MRYNYDNWKTEYPQEWDYEEGKFCSFCGESIKDINRNRFCSQNCKIAEYYD